MPTRQYLTAAKKYKRRMKAAAVRAALARECQTRLPLERNAAGQVTDRLQSSAAGQRYRQPRLTRVW